MDSPLQQKTKQASRDITFDSVRSDEPHQTLTPSLITTSPVSHEPASHLSGHAVFNVARAFSDTEAEEGTIVSDRRRRHVPLHESIREAFREWLEKTKHAIAEARRRTEEKTSEPQKILIPHPETRKDVIQKATVHTHSAPKDDLRAHIEKIRTLQKDTAHIHGVQSVTRIKEPVTTQGTPTPILKDTLPKAVPPPIRPQVTAPFIPPVVPKSSTHDEAPPLQTTRAPLPPIVTPPVVATVPHATVPIARVRSGRMEETRPVIEHNEQLMPTPVIKKMEPPVTLVKTFVPPPAPPIPTAPVAETRPTPTPTHEHAITVEKHVPQSTTVPTNPVLTNEPTGGSHTLRAIEPEFHSTPLPQEARHDLKRVQTQESPSVSQRNGATKFKQYAVRIGVLAGVIVLGIAIGIFVRSYIENRNNHDVTTKTPPVESQTGTSVDVSGGALSLSGSTRELRETLYSRITSSRAGGTQITLVMPTGTTTRNATSRDFLHFLATSLPPHTLDAFVEKFTIGSVLTDTNEPYLLFHTHNFDELFVGMLSWEATIQAELAPLFGEDIVRPAVFKDAIRNNTPARILYSTDDEEVLVYGIINRETVIITASSEAFMKLVSEL